MKKINLYCIVLLWLCGLVSAWATPLTGRNWDIQAKTEMRINRNGQVLTSHAESSRGVLLFNKNGTAANNGTAVSTQWVGRVCCTQNGTPVDVVGRWQQAVANKYSITFNLSLLNFNDNTAYIERLKQDYATLTGQSKEIRSINFVSYVDKGNILNQKRNIKGKNTVVLDLELADPGTNQTTTARVRMVTRYQGKRSSLSSICCRGTDADQNKLNSQAFLAKNAQENSVIITQSGLQYIVLQQGYGRSPTASDTVTVNYRGLLPYGQIFDSGTRVSFPLHRVIAGWTEGLQLMSEGAKYRFFIPSDLAYGEQSTGNFIGPSMALVFDVELISVE